MQMEAAGVVAREQAIALSMRLRALGARVVLVAGAFDLLHPGHIRALHEARSLGDALIVAVLATAGSGLEVEGSAAERDTATPTVSAFRTVTVAAERAEILAALARVDEVAIVEGTAMDGFVEDVCPDVVAAGADDLSDPFGRRGVIGRVDRQASRRVVRLVAGSEWSTSMIVSKIRRPDVEA
ncbi:MAG: adenylyltransferase/cytidyltransferase family protein [Acidobacteriota bacterium]